MALAKRRKTEVEHLYCRPPFPSVAAIAKQIGMAPQSIFNQSVEDPQWYADIKATRGAARLEWLSQIQAEAMAELHEMTAAALDVKREHLKHYFAMSVPMVAEKASDYVLDRVIGKPTERQDVNLKAESAVTVKHEFDYDGYRALFAEQTRGDEPGPAAEDGA